MPRSTTGQSRRFVFTWNNYSDVDQQTLRDLAQNDDCVYLVFGRERAPTTATRHLQGFVIFKRAYRWRRVVRLIRGAHVETALGTSQQASEYCKKDNDFEEFGTLPSSQGKRSDLQQSLDWLDEFLDANKRPPSEQEVARQHPQALLRYRNFMAVARLRAPDPELRTGELRDWQSSLARTLEEDADDRTIHFVVDPEGGKGKSFLQQWLLTKYPRKVQLLGCGRREDLTCAIDESKSIFLFDIPRHSMQHLQYTVLEQLKNGTVFSSKYQSTMKVLRTIPHVAVFTNEYPDLTALTNDRFNIIELR